jgi:hypothetical protein
LLHMLRDIHELVRRNAVNENVAIENAAIEK